MTARLRGVAAAPGAAVAAAWHYDSTAAAGDGRQGAAMHGLDEAARLAAAELELLAGRLRGQGNAEEAEILDAQAMMAVDDELLGDARTRVAAGGFVADAILAAGEAAATALEGLDDEVLAARASDVRDVARRIARNAVGAKVPELTERSIAIAKDLPPSVTAELRRDLLAGIALEAGSRTAHATILARALGIPAVVGVPDLCARTASAAVIGIDGGTGEVVVDPDAADRAGILRAAAAAAERVAMDAALAARPLQTRDGKRVTLAANIGRQNEAASALERRAEAIGLFRTEFMFMGRGEAPDEDEQARAYATVFSTFGARPVVVRLIDLGGDKDLPYLSVPREANPFLGVRAIRLARQDPDLILTQLRAILRAGAETATQPWIMAPMVADLDDVDLFDELLEGAVAAVVGARRPRRGIMIEIPSAVVLAEELAGRVDFLSIGTNDLTQYLLAADRTNPVLADQQDGLHPAVVRSIASVVEAGRATGTHVAVCGELAGDPAGAVVLVGLGIDELSMEPTSFGPVKRALASVLVEEAREVARGALTSPDARTARRLVDDLLTAREGRP